MAVAKKKDSGKTAAVKSTKQRKPRIERILKKRQPLVIENNKKALIMKGHHTSDTICSVLSDIYGLTKPNSKMLSRKNEILPFEDANSIEFLAGKADCSLFALGSHTKKRPNNLVLGRLFDGHVLDMFEFGVNSDTFAAAGSSSMAAHSKAMGSKPIFVFLGEQWDADSTYTRLQNMLVDFFRAERLDKISLKGLDHVLGWAVLEDGRICCRAYTVSFERSGSRVPTVGLEAMGPFMDLTLRRTRLAPSDVWNLALKQAKKPNTAKKVKNLSTNAIGDKVGRLHVQKQALDGVVTKGKKMKALRTAK